MLCYNKYYPSSHIHPSIQPAIFASVFMIQHQHKSDGSMAQINVLIQKAGL